MHGTIVHCEIPYLEDAKFVVLDCSLELQEMKVSRDGAQLGCVASLSVAQDPVGCKQEIAREGKVESLRMIELLVEDQIRSLARNGVQVLLSTADVALSYHVRSMLTVVRSVSWCAHS